MPMPTETSDTGKPNQTPQLMLWSANVDRMVAKVLLESPKHSSVTNPVIAFYRPNGFKVDINNITNTDFT